MYRIREEVDLKDEIVFAHGNGLIVAAEPEKERRGEHNTPVVERDVTKIRSEDIPHV